MISVLGPEGTAEYTAACTLCELIRNTWPEVDQSEDDDIRIVASAKCYGQRTTDIDLIVFILLKKPQLVPFEDTEQEPVYVRSLCLTIEHKTHQSSGVVFEGNQVKVRYDNHWHPVTEQAHLQQVALRNFFKQHKLESPFVTDLIWLPNVPPTNLPDATHNIVGASATWGDFLDRVLAIKKPKVWHTNGFQELDAFRKTSADQVSDIVGLLTTRLEMSPLDRLKVERIGRHRVRQSNERQYMEKMGEQLLIFKGRGGTGKTLRLLQLAHDLYTERDARVLLLTYNKALVADLQRLLAFIDAGNVDSRRVIDIRTFHSFLYCLVKHLGLANFSREPFIKNLEKYEQKVLSHLRRAVIRAENPVTQLINAAPALFNWDYVFIDEAQDWPESERDLLFLLYDYRRFVLADGVDQMVRSGYHTHWRDSIDRQQSQVVTLKKSLRLKAGLCTFAHAVAQQLDLPSWRIEQDDTMYGGRVIILEGLYADDRRYHDDLMNLNEGDKNYPIDMLFCVPPSLVNTNRPDYTYSYVARRFQKWGYEVWDGTDDETRNTYPTRLEQIRIVQYDSCRGLEAWMCVNLGLDELYDYKKQQYQPPAQTTFEFRDDEREAHLFAAGWLMIPLTRAIDTLVLQVRSSDHYITRVLKAAAAQCPDVVEWRTFTADEPALIPVS